MGDYFDALECCHRASWFIAVADVEQAAAWLALAIEEISERNPYSATVYH